MLKLSIKLVAMLQVSFDCEISCFKHFETDYIPWCIVFVRLMRRIVEFFEVLIIRQDTIFSVLLDSLLNSWNAEDGFTHL